MFLRVDVKRSHHTHIHTHIHTHTYTEMMDVNYVNMVIILQCVCTLDYHVVHLKYIQLYLTNFPSINF